MTRIAPTLTLLAVAALGGGMFVANAINDPAAATGATPDPAPAAVAAPAAPAAPNVLDLSQLPVAGGPPAAAGSGRTEISLAELPVAGAPDGAGGAAPGRTEISLADLAVAQPGAPAAGQPAAYAGRTDDDAKSVAVAVQDGKASGYVCDGKKVEAWLTGTATDGTLSLRSKSGRTVLTGTVTATGVDGTVTVDDVESGYSAAATDPAAAARDGRQDVGQVVSRLGGS